MTAELAPLRPGRVLAQYGPMRLVITADGPAGPDSGLAEAAGRYAFGLLPRLVPARELFRRPRHRFEPDFDEPLLNKMVAAVNLTGPADLGPMAAVAGTVAESVTEYLKEAGAVRALVDNGGDLAVYLAPGQTVTVGIRLGLKEKTPSRQIRLDGDRRPFWGVCSSGLGGRSLTRGVADTALCVAASAAVADAAATALGNACDLVSPKIKRVPAETLQPATDIPGLLVTESVASLTENEMDQALDRAQLFARGLEDKGIILGALTALGGRLRLTPHFETQVAPLLKANE